MGLCMPHQPGWTEPDHQGHGLANYSLIEFPLFVPRDLQHIKVCGMKHLYAFVFFIFQGVGMAQDMKGLPDWTREHPQWLQTKPELAYVANRCASAFDLVGNYFIANGVLDEQRRSANIFLNHSDIYVRLGYFLTVKQGTSEPEALLQYNLINNYYKQLIDSNIQSNIQIMLGPLGDDVELCLANYWSAQVTVKELEQEYANHSPKKNFPNAPDQKLDLDMLQIVWSFIKAETEGPADFPMPPLVVDASLPTNARMVFQYPSEEQPDNSLMVSVSPRTLTQWSRAMVSWAAGHELTHYAFLMRDNGWVRQEKYQNKTKHHCNPAFIRLTSGVADLIADQLTNTRERLRMYSEVFRSCTRHPDQ